jgi:hypothetical protein
LSVDTVPNSHVRPRLSSRASAAIVLDADGFFDWIVAHMKTKIFAAVVGLTLITLGCVKTVSDTHTATVSFGKDSVEGRYERALDQVYAASLRVVQKNGTVVTEYVPHDTLNVVRSFLGQVGSSKVWVRVEVVDPKVTSVIVEARTKWGNKDLDLAHELEKEIALQLQMQSGS